MKQKLTALSRRYVTALRKHLRQGPQASLQPALAMGRQAAALDLETSDMARIHEGAVATMAASRGRNAIIKRAEIFLPRPSPRSRKRIAPQKLFQAQSLFCLTPRSHKKALE
jgi:hypothetical protein